MNINFGNIDSPYIIKVISKYDPNKDDYTTIQQTVTMQTTINEYTGRSLEQHPMIIQLLSLQVQVKDKVTCLLKKLIKSEITYGKM